MVSGTGKKFRRHIGRALDAKARDGAPLGGTKTEATQRLQVGFAGLGSMVLVIGLASVLGNQADLTEQAAVPEAAPTTEPTEATSQSDPLVDAGIVPEIPTDVDAEGGSEEIVEDVAPPDLVEDAAPTRGENVENIGNGGQ